MYIVLLKDNETLIVLRSFQFCLNQLSIVVYKFEVYDLRNFMNSEHDPGKNLHNFHFFEGLKSLRC